MNTPIYKGQLQSDLDFAGFHALNFPDGGSGGGLPEGWVSVMDYGAHADGATDDTAAAVAAVAAATSVVYFPPGNYFFAGSIGVVPPNISLMGAPFLGPHGNVVTSSALYTPKNNLSPLAGGTCFLLTANAGSTTVANSFIKLSDNSSVTGITFYWPNQLASAGTPTAYPWAIYLGTGAASSAKYCNFVNAYLGIYIENTMFSLIEEVRGQCLLIGIKCEGNYDVTRLRGVHFNASWDTDGAAGTWQLTNGIAFQFGRNDLLIAESCFAFRYRTWIQFYDDPSHNIPPAGGGGPTASWAQIRGGGGDYCAKPVWIEQVQAQGIDIDGVHLSNTNPASDPCVTIDGTNTGSARIHNSMMLGWDGRMGTVAGSGDVTVDNCYFLGTGPFVGAPPSFGTTGWAVTGAGNFAMRGCAFRTTQTHVSLGATLGHAVVTGNMASGTFNVTNGISTAAVIANNTV